MLNIGNHNQKSLNDCADKGIPNLPKTEPNNECSMEEKKKDFGNWLNEKSNKKVGLGKANLADGIQAGKIVNDIKAPSRSTIYRYSKAIRGCNEAMTDMFRGLVVIDEDGKAWPVPIMWGTQEKAVTYVLQDNVRKDNSLVVDRLKLPLLAIHNKDIQFDQQRYTYHRALSYFPDIEKNKPTITGSEKREKDTVFGFSRGIPVNISYTLYAWTLYLEDMDQILEQILLKFSPVAYINVTGVNYETIVTLDSTGNNLDYEPGDQAIRVIKYQFEMTAQTYIPQPISRRKSVLKQKIGFYDNVDPELMKETYSKIEVTAEDENND